MTLFISYISTPPFSVHVQIQQCETKGSSNPTNNNECVYQVPENKTDIHLDCAVLEARGDINLRWIGSEYLTPDVAVSHKDRGDGIFDTQSTITIIAEELRGNNNFTCVAEGPSVNGTAVQTIQVQGLSGKPYTVHPIYLSVCIYRINVMSSLFFT